MGKSWPFHNPSPKGWEKHLKQVELWYTLETWEQLFRIGLLKNIVQNLYYIWWVQEINKNAILARFLFCKFWRIRKNAYFCTAFGEMLIAEIAQLVEHNLAKVGVASSSLVFRSLTSSESPGGGMVDAHVSGACVERHAGSSPVLGTFQVKRTANLLPALFFLLLLPPK